VATGVKGHAFHHLRFPSFMVTVRNDWYCAKKQCKLYIKCGKLCKCFEGFVERSHDKCSEDRQTLNISVKRKAVDHLRLTLR